MPATTNHNTAHARSKRRVSCAPAPLGGASAGSGPVSDPGETAAEPEVRGVGDVLLCQLLMSCLADAVVQVGRDGVIQELRVPEDFEFPLSREELVGRRVVEILPTQLGLQAMHYLEKSLRTGTMQALSCQFNLPGRVREFQARMAACSSDTVLAVIRDVTDRRQFEREILDVSQRAQLRIGQDLHDGLGQHLTGITFLSKALENKLTARGLPEAAEAAEIVRLVIQALAQTRNLARSLLPVELESGGLLPALKELASAMRSLYQLSCVVECDPHVCIQDDHLTNHLFRLAQEAVNNAVKHGQAHHIVIKLTRQKGDTVLSIIDDGTGFDPEQEKRSGLGMRIMRYRAQKIGARLEIHPAPTGGTQVVCTLSSSAQSPGESRQQES